MKKTYSGDLLKKRLELLKIDKNNETELVYKKLLEDSLEGIIKFEGLKEPKPVV